MNATIDRPKYGFVSVAAALAFHWRGYHISEKLDGVWAVREFAGSIVTGEQMPDARFYPFDIAIAFGVDISRRPWTERHAALAELFSTAPASLNWNHIATGHGAEFIEAVLARGGEGVICKAWDCPIGAKLFKVKRNETHDCRVIEKHPTRKSLHLSLDGVDCGWCGCVSEFHRIKIGDVVEVACLRRFASGKFREPRFIRSRPDKGAV